MRLKRFHLSGDFVDAYLYFDFAWLFAKDGVVRAFDVGKYCEERLNGNADAAAALFSNNQCIRHHQAPNQDSSSLANLLSSDEPIEVTPTDVDKFSYIFKTNGRCRSILDVRFYNGRAFVGSDNGIRQFIALGRNDLKESRIGQSAVDSLDDQRVSELPARQILARFGAVAAACGSAGGVLGVGAGSEDRKWRISFDHFADRSYAIELNGNAISCLVNATEVELYSVERRSAPKRSDEAFVDDARDSLELTEVPGRGFDAETAQLNRLIAKLASATHTFLFKDVLWVLASDGFYRFYLARNGEITNPHRAGLKDKPPARVLSAQGSDAGLVVESDDAIFILNENRWRKLISEPVYSVRSYPNSKRYKKLITMVTRERVELVAIV